MGPRTLGLFTVIGIGPYFFENDDGESNTMLLMLTTDFLPFSHLDNTGMQQNGTRCHTTLANIALLQE